MVEFAKKVTVDLNNAELPEQTLIIKSDDPSLIAAVTDIVRKFSSVKRVIEEATIPREDGYKLITQELSLFAENSAESPYKQSRNVARRHVEAYFEDFPQSVPFRTLGELYKFMTGKDTARSGCPATHLRMLNKKRLPNRPKLVNIIRMDVRGKEYQNNSARAM